MDTSKVVAESARIKHLKALIDLSILINSSLDIAVIRQKAIAGATEVTGSEAGSLLFVDDETGELYFDVALGEKGEAVKSIRIKKGQGIAGWVADNRRPVMVNDVRNDPRFFKGGDKKSGFITRSMVCTPVQIKGRLLGVLQAINKKGGRYNRDDLALLMALSNQVAVAMENARLYRELQETFLNTINSFAETVDKRDPYTGGHTRRVMRYSLATGKVLGLSGKDMLDLRFAAVLHDIGKIGVRDDILLKNGKLTDVEFAVIRKHTVFGAEILAHIKQLKDVVPGVKYHHEKNDGSGYPERLKCDDIPLIAKIIAVADAFDAMTTDRPYHKGLKFETALVELQKSSGTHFAPEVVNAFTVAYKGFKTAKG